MNPLEVQIATPVMLNEADIAVITARSENVQQGRPISEDEKLARLSQVMTEHLKPLTQRMHDHWDGDKPARIEVLPTFIHLPDLLEAEKQRLPANEYGVILGRRDDRLEPFILSLKTHFVVVGLPLSGRTTLLRTWIMALSRLYTPLEVNMVLIDFQKRLIRYGGKYNLGDLPQVVRVLSEPEDLTDLVDKLEYEYHPDRDYDRYPIPELFVFIDNYDDFADLAPNKDDLRRLGQLARQQRDRGLHFVLCGSPTIIRSNEELRKQVGQSRLGFALRTSDAVEALGGKMPRSLRDVELPVGRGFLIDTGRTALAQIATMEPFSTSGLTYTAIVDDYIERDQIEVRYRWYIEQNPPPAPEPEAESAVTPVSNGNSNGAASTAKVSSPLSVISTPPSTTAERIAAQNASISEEMEERIRNNQANPYAQQGLLNGTTIRKLPPELATSLNLDLRGKRMEIADLMSQPAALLDAWDRARDAAAARRTD